MAGVIGFGDVKIEVAIEVAGRRREGLVEETSEEESGGYEDESGDLVSASA